MSIKEVETAALQLAPEDQARLLHRLALSLDSLGESELTNEELQQRWKEFEASGQAGIEASKLREQAKRRYGL